MTTAATMLRGLDRRARRSVVGLGDDESDDEGEGTAAVGRDVLGAGQRRGAGDADGRRRAACARHAFGDVDWRSRCARGAMTSTSTSSGVSESSYVERLRASATFAAGATTRLMCAAFGAHGSISRVNARLTSTRRIRDEARRAKAMGEIRGNCKWAWAKESACQGALATRAERYEEAEKCFEQAIGLDPKHVRAYVGRGACYANQRKYAAALKDFERALEIAPDDARATSYKAAVVEKMEKVSRSRNDWSTRGGCEARKEDVDSLRARVLNPARGLEALRRGEMANKSYDLELGDDDEEDKDRRSDGKRRRHKAKRRKKDHNSNKRGRSDHRSSRKSSKRSRRDVSSSSSSSYSSPARK